MGVVVGVVRVRCVVRMVVEGAGVVVGWDGGRLPEDAHGDLANGSWSDDATGAGGDGGWRRKRPDESGEVPRHAALQMTL